MSKKIYSYKTGKLYESESGMYSVSVTERDITTDEVVDQYMFSDKFETLEDADAAIAAFIDGIKEEDNIADRSCTIEETRDGYRFCANSSLEWEFAIRESEPYEDARRTKLDDDDDDFEEFEPSETMEESVADRFAKYRKIYESDEDEEKDDEESKGDEKSDDEESKDDEPKDDEKKEDAEDEEDKELTGIVLVVAHGDGQKLKDELIDKAGIDEKYIEVIESEKEAEGDEGDEDDRVRIDVKAVADLQDYIQKSRGFDICDEDHLNADIITDGDDDEKKEDDEEEKNDKEDKKDKDSDDDVNFDMSDDEFGDLFA